jgi:hypothetical protein
MMKLSRLLLALLAACALQPIASAQTLRPVILSAYPPGLQRGRTAEIAVTGMNGFQGAYRAVIEGSGVTAEVVPVVPDKDGKSVDAVTLRVTAAPDAAPGVREFHVVTPRGVTNAGWLVVGSDPEIVEKEPNDRPETAQPVLADGEDAVTINGRLQIGGDRDLYRFTARAGDQFAFAVLGARLQERCRDGGPQCDPVLVLSDGEGHELATSDDYFRADPMLPYRFEKAGGYLIEVRDARLRGSPAWLYRLTITRRPVVTGVFPIAATRGAALDLQPIGFNLGQVRPAHLELPASAPAGTRAVSFEGPGGSLPSVPLQVSELPEVVEAEPNDSCDQAQRVSFPGGVSGRIGSAFDVDHFLFHAERAQMFLFEVEAQRLGSSLDPQFALLDGRGMVLLSTETGLGRDPSITWTAPAAGDYVIQVTDASSRGGEDYFYHLVARAAGPDFALQLDDSRVHLGPGGSAAWFVQATRLGGFNGEIQLAVSGLPAGVAAVAGRIPPGMRDGTIILSAPADARPDFATVAISGTAQAQRPDGAVETIARAAQPRQPWYTAGGGRRHADVAIAGVCITEAPDVVVTPAVREVSLVPGQMSRVEVAVGRRPGYAGPVSLDLLLQHLKAVFANPLPPGVTIVENQSKLYLKETETKGWITLLAAPTAARVERLPLAILGQVPLNLVVKQNFASPPLYLTVASKR